MVVFAADPVDAVVDVFDVVDFADVVDPVDVIVGVVVEGEIGDVVDAVDVIAGDVVEGEIGDVVDGAIVFKCVIVVLVDCCFNCVAIAMTLSERATSVLGNSRVVGATAVENIFVANNVIADANALFGFVVARTTDKVCGVIGKSIFISDFDDCNFNASVANAESCFSASIASVESFVAAVFSTVGTLVNSVVVAFFCKPEVKIAGEIEDAYTSFRGILVEDLSLSTVSVTGLAALLDNCCCWCS